LLSNDHDLIRRIHADLADSYDEELELELEDRNCRRDRSGVDADSDDDQKESRPPLLPRAVPAAGRAGEAAGLGVARGTRS
jgi:hypothetical protein